MIELKGKSGGAWAARTPDHLIKSLSHYSIKSKPYREWFFAFLTISARSINNLGDSFMHINERNCDDLPHFCPICAPWG